MDFDQVWGNFLADYVTGCAEKRGYKIIDLGLRARVQGDINALLKRKAEREAGHASGPQRQESNRPKSLVLAELLERARKMLGK